MKLKKKYFVFAVITLGLWGHSRLYPPVWQDRCLYLPVCIVPPGQASCPRTAPVSCDHWPVSPACACSHTVCILLCAFPSVQSAFLYIYFVSPSASLSNWSLLVLSPLVLPPEPATYIHNPAVFAFLRYFFSPSRCHKSETRVKAGKMQFLAPHLLLFGASLIHS